MQLLNSGSSGENAMRWGCEDDKNAPNKTPGGTGAKQSLHLEPV